MKMEMDLEMDLEMDVEMDQVTFSGAFKAKRLAGCRTRFLHYVKSRTMRGWILLLLKRTHTQGETNVYDDAYVGRRGDGRKEK
jgi:hypothetical protein